MVRNAGKTVHACNQQIFDGDLFPCLPEVRSIPEVVCVKHVHVNECIPRSVKHARTDPPTDSCLLTSMPGFEYLSISIKPDSDMITVGHCSFSPNTVERMKC